MSAARLRRAALAFLPVAPFHDDHVAELCIARAALLIEILGPVEGWRS